MTTVTSHSASGSDSEGAAPDEFAAFRSEFDLPDGLSSGVVDDLIAPPMTYGELHDERAFRHVLGQFTTGVTVVTTVQGGRGYAMAVNSFAAVSLDPPLVLWSVRKSSASAAAFVDAGHFAISILESSQSEVSNSLGRRHSDPLSLVAWSAGRDGDPLIDGAIGYIECATESVIDGGDHHILLGRVRHFARAAGEPLLFGMGEYGWFGRQPAATTELVATAVASADEDVLFPTLVRETEHQLSALFDTRRRQLGLSSATTRVINRLALGAETIAGIQAKTPFGLRAVEDALAELHDAGLVSSDHEGRWELTDVGLELRAALRREAEIFTAEQMAGIDPEELAIATRVLDRLRAQ